MKRKITKTISLLPLLVLLLLSGCSYKGVSEAQLEKDILKREEIQNCFYSNFVNKSEYKIKAQEIVKEQFNKEEKEDIIYSDLTIENKYFSVDLSVQCVYNYYNKGGWILDEFTILEKAVNPIRAAEGQNVIDKISEESVDKHYEDRIAIDCLYDGEEKILRHGTLSIVDCVFDKENMQTKLSVCYKSDVVDVKGHYLLYFDSTEGWLIQAKEDEDSNTKIFMYVDGYTSDYSSVVGKYTSVLDKNANVVGYDLNIAEISKDSILYSLKIDGYEAYTYLDSEILQEEFDPLTGSVSLRTGKYFMLGIEADLPVGTYIYNPIDECWDSYYGPTYPDSGTYSYAHYAMPRQLGRE